ncbi:MAG TPA: FAD-dependent oxidoreductase, partial [Acidimicrobiales bacterium]|nr:FAD-dependent oxidoreductase [Acidimicrobiales bacterium]
RDQDIAVVGGGDSALEEALFLTRFARTVTLVHRRKELRASKIMQDRAFANHKIVFRWDTVVTEVVGDTKVSGVAVRNVVSGAQEVLPVTGVFVAIGHVPNSGIFAGQLDVDEAGYIRTTSGSRTNVEGVFVCGDVQDHFYRQAVTAAGSGCMAAIDAERWLEARGS